MSDFWEFLKAKKPQWPKKRRTFVEHLESGFKGSMGKYANQYVNNKINELGEAGKGITREQREELRQKIMNDMLNMPQNFGLNVLHGAKASDFHDPHKAAKKRGKAFVSHAESGFEGSVGKRAAQTIRDLQAQGIDIPDEQVEPLRKKLAQQMLETPEKYGLTIMNKKPAPAAPAAPAPAPLPTLASNPILPKEKKPQTSQTDKIMRAIKLLQTNDLPINQEAIEALLPHIEDTPQMQSNPMANPYDTGLTPEGKFQPARLGATWQGDHVETPDKMEEMRQHFRENPDRRVQDDDFRDRERIKDIESRGHTPQSILDLIAGGDFQTGGTEEKPSMKEIMNRGTGFDTHGNPIDETPADPMGLAGQIAGERYKPKSEGGGLVEDDTKPATHRLARKLGMTEAELNDARQKEFQEEMAARATANTKHDQAIAGAPENLTNPQGIDDWMNVLELHRENPQGGDLPSTSPNRTKTTVEGMLDENGNLKEEYT
tara:strand:+ start:14022 stop:15485 length:1464 start_codon:yes stop_codon:yes gene_type:complete